MADPELERVLEELRATKGKAPPPPVPEPRPNLFEQMADDIEQSRLEAADEPRPVEPEVRPSVPVTIPREFLPLPNPTTGQPFDVMEFEEEDLEAQGLHDVAQEVRNWKATVYGREGSQRLRDLYERNRQRAWGRFSPDPEMYRREIVASNLKAQQIAAGVKDWLDDSQFSNDPDPVQRHAEAEQMRSQMRAAAEDMAQRTVTGIIGTSEARGNVVADMDPELTQERIARGQTFLGRLTGLGFVSDALEAAEGTPLEGAADWVRPVRDFMGRLLAPFYAMGQPGGKSVQARGSDPVGGVAGEDRPVLNQQKESALNWFFRAGLWSVIGSVAFDPELETESEGLAAPAERILKYWGSPEHINRIYSGRYDITQEMRPLGKLIAEATPWVDPEWMTAVIGFMGITGLILFEPDLVTLSTLGLGKIPKLAKALPLAGELLAPSTKMLDNVFLPQMAKWLRLLEQEGKSVDEALDGLREGSPLHSLAQALKVEWSADMLADGMRFHGTKLRDAPKNIESAIEKMAADLKRANEIHTSRTVAKTTAEKQGQNLLDEAHAHQAYVQAETQIVRNLHQLLKQEADLQSQLSMISRTEFDGVASLARLRRRFGDTDGIVDQLGNIRTQRADLARRIEALEDGATKQRLIQQATELDGRLAGLTRQQQVNQLLNAYDDVVGFRVARAETLTQLAKQTEDFVKSKGIRMSPELARTLAGSQGITKAMREAADLGNPNRFSGLKTVLNQTRNSVASASKRLRQVAATGRNLADEGRRLLESGTALEKGLEELAGDITKLELGPVVAENAPKVLAAVIRRNMDAAKTLRKRLLNGESLDGTDEALRYADSVAGSIWRTLDDIPDRFTLEMRDAWQAQLEQRYGLKAVQEALMGSPLLGDRFLKAGLAEPTIVRQMLETERSARMAAKRGPSELATLKLALDDVVDTVYTTPAITYERFLATGMTVGARLAKMMDPILARGLNRSPDDIRQVYRQAAETYTTAVIHAGRVLRAGGPEDLYRFITTSDRFDVGHTIATFNQAGMTPHQKWFAHLRSIFDDAESWGADIGVRAIVRAWLPPGNVAENAAQAAHRQFRRLVQESNTADDLLAKLLAEKGNKLRGVVFAVEGASDAVTKARQFIYKGILHGAVQHDAVRGLLKSVGPGLSADAANALNFFTNKLEVGGARTVTATDAKAARELMERFRLPLTQELEKKVVDPLRVFTRTMTEATRTSNDLVRLATVHGADVVVPRYVREAMNDIGDGVAKELRQFNEDRGAFARNFRSFFTMWRTSVVNGWFLPRIAHFGTTYIGDLSQLVSALGFRDGARVAMQNTLTYVPFLGLKLNERLSRSPGMRMVSAVTNPTMSRIMQADPDLRLMTPDGPMAAPDLLEAARRQGALDSISTGDLAELMDRGRRKGTRVGTDNLGFDIPATLMKRAEAVGLFGPSHPVKATAEYLEAVQHRIRTQVFVEAMQKGATEIEAGAIMRRAMLDWRHGITPWEAATVGQVATFWTFRRQQLAQMGSFLSDAMATQTAGPLWRVATGNTPIGRTRKYGALLSAVPEAIYWADPDMRVGDEEQVRQAGMRDSPTWRGSEPILFGYKMEPERELWFSEVLGKPVTYEQLTLPGLTTLDAMQVYTNLANTALATSVWVNKPAGVTIDDVDRVWAKNVRDFTDTLNPGIDTMVNGALGGEDWRSTRGVGVPRNQALLLKRLGWGEFVHTYTDKYGRTRYVTDPNILTMAGRLLLHTPPVDNLLQSYAVFDVPGYSESVTRGLAESFFRLTGLVRFAQMDPVKRHDWAVANQDRELEAALKDAKARARER